MVVESSELELVWPAALFAAEARAVLASGVDDDALGGLLAEAFHGDRGEQLLQQVANTGPHRFGIGADPWASASGNRLPVREPFMSRATARLVAELADAADTLPRHTRRPLYRQRQRAAHPVAALSVPECKARFAKLIVDLTILGYFEEAFGSQCNDSPDDPSTAGQRMLAERLELDHVVL